MSKYRINAMAAFTVNVTVDAESRADAFEKYESMLKDGKLDWQFLDTMAVNCDQFPPEKRGIDFMTKEQIETFSEMLKR